MDRALRRLDAADEPRVLRDKRRLPGTAVGIIVAVAVVGALIWGIGWSHTPASQITSSKTGQSLANTPTTTHIHSTARLLPVAIAARRSSAYSFLNGSAGRPVMWEPCRPIHYVVRRGEEPAAFDASFQSAVADISRATGLKFIDDGPTGELLLSDPTARLVYQPRTYGDRWAPVLVTWSSSAESPALAGSEAGFGGADVWAPPDGPPRYVSGVVAFNVADLLMLSARPHGATLVHDVLLHELGHLVGLDHVQDKTQIMYPTLTKPLSGFGAGDLAGLARLGNGSCYTDY